MSRRSQSDPAARIQSFVDARPSWEPFLVLGALPVLLNAFFLIIMIAEAENSWEIFGVSMLAAGGVGLFGGQRGYGAPATFLAAVWIPAPGGSAQSLLRWALAVEAPDLGRCRGRTWVVRDGGLGSDALRPVLEEKNGTLPIQQAVTRITELSCRPTV